MLNDFFNISCILGRLKLKIKKTTIILKLFFNSEFVVLNIDISAYQTRQNNIVSIIKKKGVEVESSVRIMILPCITLKRF